MKQATDIERYYITMVQLNRLSTVARLVAQPGLDVNCLSCAAFDACLYLNNVSMLKLLLDNGLKPTLRQIDEGIKLAKSLNHLKFVPILVKLAQARRLKAVVAKRGEG